MNKAFLIGRLTGDPEVRVTPNSVTVCTFRIAVNRRYTNQSGERAADFHNVVVWRKLGELCGKYLAKGRLVAVVGEIQNRSYEAKDGSKRYTTEIVADEIEFLTPKSATEGGQTAATQPNSNQTANSTAAAAASANTANTPSYTAPANDPYDLGAFGGYGSFGDFGDDELPF